MNLKKYEGHSEGPWRTAEGQPYDDEGSHLDIVDANGVLVTETSYFTDNNHPNIQLIADAPLLLAEVKRLRKALHIEEQIVQAFYEYREACCFDHCEAWMLENGHRVMVKIDDDEQSEWRVEVAGEEELHKED
tara:strand:+ start:43 stop:441 length:399 start_codon:yes stop_codon:yes gene_type:complete